MKRRRIPPGPPDLRISGDAKSFNGRLRDECLNEHLFSNLNEARRIIEDWRIDYNTNRPHTSLNGLTPTEFAARPHQSKTRTGSPHKRGQSGAGQVGSETVRRRQRERQ